MALTYEITKLDDGRFQATFTDTSVKGLDLTFTMTDTVELRLKARAMQVVTDATHDVVCRRLERKPVQAALW